MRSIATIARIALGLFVCSAGLVLAADAPAAADDCATLVKDVKDLTDESKLRDCLRTGNNWGRVIGVVVAGTAVVIAATGLARPSRPPEKIPGRTPLTGSVPDGPCMPMFKEVSYLHDLLSSREVLETKIVTEWKSYAQGAKVLIGSFRDLKTVEWRYHQAITFSTIYNYAWWGVVFCGAGVLFRFAAAKLAAGWTAVTGGLATTAAATGATAEAVVEVTALSAEAKAAAATMMKITEKAFSDRKPSVVSKGAKPTSILNVPWDGWKAVREFHGESLKHQLLAAISPVLAQYTKAARAYNRAFAQWAVDRQNDLEHLDNAIFAQASRASAASASCPGGERFLKTPTKRPAIQLHVLQVPESLGDKWFMGNVLGIDILPGT